MAFLVFRFDARIHHPGSEDGKLGKMSSLAGHWPHIPPHLGQSWLFAGLLLWSWFVLCRLRWWTAGRQAFAEPRQIPNDARNSIKVNESRHYLVAAFCHCHLPVRQLPLLIVFLRGLYFKGPKNASTAFPSLRLYLSTSRLPSARANFRFRQPTIIVLKIPVSTR